MKRGYTTEKCMERLKEILPIVIFGVCIFIVFKFGTDRYYSNRADILNEPGVIGIDSTGGYEVDKKWVGENLYRVSTYRELPNGNYVVYLLSVEPSTEKTFEELCRTFKHTPYSSINSYRLEDGVNCQGMVCYIVDWCKKNDCVYKIGYTHAHTYIDVCVDSQWYRMSFTYSNAELYEI